MVTAFDDPHAASVSVFTDVDGRYDFPPLTPGAYRLRARRIGWREAVVDQVVVSAEGASSDFSLALTDDLNSQLPPTYFKSLLQWPSAHVSGDFTRACANCHQIGDPRWREPRTPEQWQEVINRMIGYGGIPFFEETRAVLFETLAHTFASDAPAPQFPVPPPPSGDAVRAVIYEWEIDPVQRPGCHDLELGRDGLVYTVPGVWTLNPRTFERGHLPCRVVATRSSATATAICGSPPRDPRSSSSSTSRPGPSRTLRSRASATISARIHTPSLSMRRDTSGTR
jgi:hypothetical protein